MISDDDLRDHFERQYAQGGQTADMARAVLDLIDERDVANEELEEIPEIIGDVREAAKRLEIFESLIEWAEADELIAAQPGETLEEQLKGLVGQYADYEQQSFDLVELCSDAGLLAPYDFETDPIPLIRMFLPIEGD